MNALTPSPTTQNAWQKIPVSSVTRPKTVTMSIKLNKLYQISSGWGQSWPVYSTAMCVHSWQVKLHRGSGGVTSILRIQKLAWISIRWCSDGLFTSLFFLNQPIWVDIWLAQLAAHKILSGFATLYFSLDENEKYPFLMVCFLYVKP